VKQLSGLDAAFLTLETTNSTGHVGVSNCGAAAIGMATSAPTIPSSAPLRS